MRGLDERTGSLFSFYVDLEDRIPAHHPLRLIRRIVNDVLVALDGEFVKLYADSGRRASEPQGGAPAAIGRALLGRRHAGCGVGFDEELADGSDEPPSGGRNGDRDFHGETRRNDTHSSTSDPEARPYRKGKGKEAKLSYIGQRADLAGGPPAIDHVSPLDAHDLDGHGTGQAPNLRTCDDLFHPSIPPAPLPGGIEGSRLTAREGGNEGPCARQLIATWAAGWSVRHRGQSLLRRIGRQLHRLDDRGIIVLRLVDAS